MNTLPIKLVVCLPDNGYQQFVGACCAHHIQTSRPLTASEIERFRTNPTRVIERAQFEGEI